ncbi:MAG: methyltransferase domain-containing protein [Chitinophagaceae bacterium]|nr:MAG: methyltransferase domain-containing protein [Chitinophagaceae bacterium]
MLQALLPFLVCPVTRSELKPVIFSHSEKLYGGAKKEIFWEGILYSETDWFYPIIDGIPRLQVEAFLDYEKFLKKKLPDYETRKQKLLATYGDLVHHVVKKNKRTKESFELEWGLFDYKEDKTWELKGDELLGRFLTETDESKESVRGKLIFDAGCGNGQLNQYIAKCGALVIGMDFSKSIERAFHQNQEERALFIQGDVQYPPVKSGAFDIVHSSGVLICTNNTEHSFSCIDPCVKKDGKLSVWLYHPRKNFIHNTFNFIRGYTSKLPLKFQYHLYRFTIFPLSYVIKRLKGNKQNAREMMVSIMDWFSPEYRWEHTPEEATGWFTKRNYKNVKVTTTDTFGFNIIGVKK